MLQPGLWQARYGLASALLQQGQVVEVIEQYRAILVARPDFVEVLNRLAWLLAVNPDAHIRNGTQAVELAERAATLTRRQQPAVLDTLAAAYAEAGRFTEAIATARRALGIATQQNDRGLAAGLNARIALYQAGTPFRTQ